jgi:hypothetical protein
MHKLKSGKCETCGTSAVDILRAAFIKPDGTVNWAGKASFDPDGEMPTMEEMGDVDPALAASMDRVEKTQPLGGGLKLETEEP